MHNIKRYDLSQVKFSELSTYRIDGLISQFRIGSVLSKAEFTRSKGFHILEMLLFFILILLEKAKTVNQGLKYIKSHQHKTAINDFLNNTSYNWRKFMVSVAVQYIKKHPADKGKFNSLIIDDTSKPKTGRYVEYLSWFYDHAKLGYYMGYQIVFSAFSNGTTCIPLDFEIKTGRKRCKHAKKGNYSPNSHTAKRYKESRKTKTKISMDMIKRAIKHRIKFAYVLWDSWFNNSTTYKFVFNYLIPKGIHLVSMVKLSSEKYFYNNEEFNIKEIFKSIKKWNRLGVSDILFKSVIVELIDKSTTDRKIIGKVKLCFYKFPNQKKNKYKVLISTNLELSAEEVLKIYTQRWGIEVMIKDLKQYMGFNQAMSSKYAPQIAHLTIICVFYMMFCSLKEKDPSVTMFEIIFDIRCEYEEHCFDLIFRYMFKETLVCFVKFAKNNGIDTGDLLEHIHDIIDKFWESVSFENKIIEVEHKCKKRKIA